MFRVKMYATTSGDYLKAPEFVSTPLASWLDADRYLMLAYDSGFCFGGGIERLVPGIGWIVCNYQPEESEVIQ